jgi:hypothetical protein
VCNVSAICIIHITPYKKSAGEREEREETKKRRGEREGRGRRRGYISSTLSLGLQQA